MRDRRILIVRLAFILSLVSLVACGGLKQEPASTTGGGGAGHGGSGTGAMDQGGSANAGSGGAACSNSLPVLLKLPPTLSAAGLYEDIDAKMLGDAMQAFTPRFQLWSDGADKSRWVYLPECAVINTSDMNDWEVPVGTRLFKEFVVEGTRIETRLITRSGAGPNDFIFASYVWNEDESEASLVDVNGLTNAKGTAHDIPSEDACRRCHGSHAAFGGRPSRALGLSAVQLSHDNGGLSLDSLANEGRLSAPAATAIEVPGDANAQAALGYLHANCGHCHNSTSDRVKQVDLDLWLGAAHDSVESTAAFLSAVGKPNQLFNDQHVTGRIVAGDPSESAVSYRMGQRGNNAQMPPIASEVVDTAGRNLVDTWIGELK